MEAWRDVVGYRGIYQVSSLGRVKSFQRYLVVGRILKPAKNAAGYLMVTLCRGGKRTYLYLHRLVAERFLGPAPSPKHEVNHKNGNKADNRVENLEWVTRPENQKHMCRVLGYKPTTPDNKGEANGSSKLTRRQVKEIRKLYATGEYSYRALGEMFGVCRSTIGDVIRHDTWKHVP